LEQAGCGIPNIDIFWFAGEFPMYRGSHEQFEGRPAHSCEHEIGEIMFLANCQQWFESIEVNARGSGRPQRRPRVRGEW
jgi:hypothetical protein